MQYLQLLDIRLFFLINQTLSNKLFDLIMPFVTHLDNWRLVILLIWLILIIKGRKKGRVAAFLIIPVITMSDQISASVFKPLIGRIRPCYDLDFVRLLVNCGGKLAFPSSHASNISGAAMLFSLIYNRGTGFFWFIALMVGYSRVYVGVHYPGDVLFGFFLGSSISIFIYILYLVIASRNNKINYMKS